MIATCPKCSVRYRIAREKLKPEGVRMRCARCEAVFRVRPPVPAPAPAATAAPPPLQGEAPPARVTVPPVPPGEALAPERPAPPVAPEEALASKRPVPPVPDPPRAAARPEPVSRERLALVAIPDAELGKEVASALAGCGLHASVVHDGVEAMLEVQRQLPGVVILSASLPKMYGFQVCEVMKRNESLRSIPVVLVGAIYNTERYRREPNELYGADAYIEDPDLPDGLIPILERIGVPITPAAPSLPEPTPPAPPLREAMPPAPPQPAPPHAAVAEPARPPAPEPAAAQVDDGLAEERAKAERLARIIVSDIILYNEQKFADALQRGCVVEAMTPDLEEGRDLFRDRINERVREEQDYLVEELLRVARQRATA